MVMLVVMLMVSSSLVVRVMSLVLWGSWWAVVGFPTPVLIAGVMSVELPAEPTTRADSHA